MPIFNQVVSGGGSAPAGLYREYQLEGTGRLIPNLTTTHIMDFTGMTDVMEYLLAGAYLANRAITGAIDMSDLTTVSGSFACYDMFFGCTGLTSADLSALTTITGGNGCNSMFYNCTGLTSVDISALTTVYGNYACGSMFYNCTGLTGAVLSALTTVSGLFGCSSMFYGCTGLVSADLSALTTITAGNGCNNMFGRCTGLTSADLSALTTITGNAACAYMFYNCTSLATVYIGGTTAIDFGTRVNQFGNMFDGCTQNIDVYAPAANQTAIEAFSGYPNFGGTGTVTWHWRS